MNLLQLLSPKSDVTYIKERMCVGTAMDTLRISGYSAVPVISEDGLYKGVVSEGDFLWAMVDGLDTDGKGKPARVSSLVKEEKHPALRIDAELDEALNLAMNENFVPMVDDRGMFIGIITRKNVISYLMKNR